VIACLLYVEYVSLVSVDSSAVPFSRSLISMNRAYLFVTIMLSTCHMSCGLSLLSAVADDSFATPTAVVQRPHGNSVLQCLAFLSMNELLDARHHAQSAVRALVKRSQRFIMQKHPEHLHAMVALGTGCRNVVQAPTPLLVMGSVSLSKREWVLDIIFVSERMIHVLVMNQAGWQ
jgi:hypothetical protein